MENAFQEKWLVILNPHAGSGKGEKDRDDIIRKLTSAEFKFELVISEYPKHIIQLTIDAIGRGFRKLIIAGGDGSLNEAVNGIFQQIFVLLKKLPLG